MIIDGWPFDYGKYYRQSIAALPTTVWHIYPANNRFSNVSLRDIWSSWASMLKHYCFWWWRTESPVGCMKKTQFLVTIDRSVGYYGRPFRQYSREYSILLNSYQYRVRNNCRSFLFIRNFFYLNFRDFYFSRCKFLRYRANFLNLH